MPQTPEYIRERADNVANEIVWDELGHLFSNNNDEAANAKAACVQAAIKGATDERELWMEFHQWAYDNEWRMSTHQSGMWYHPNTPYISTERLFNLFLQHKNTKDKNDQNG